MTYKGTVRNGTIVLEGGAALPEGAQVRIDTDGQVGPLADASSSFDAQLDQLYLQYKVKRGLEQAAAGETYSHDEARQYLAKWLS
jgi:hypothetical protein